MALGLVLVASILSRPDFQLAFVMCTTSEDGGDPGVSVIVVVRVTPNHLAVMVTVVDALTGDVARLNVPVELLALTTVSCGTRATAGSLLNSCTTAPWVMGPVNRTVPVA